MQYLYTVYDYRMLDDLTLYAKWTKSDGSDDKKPDADDSDTDSDGISDKDPSESRTALQNTCVVGEKVDILSLYFSKVADIARYKVVLEDTNQSASSYAAVTAKGILSTKKPGTVTIIPQTKTGKNQYADIEGQSCTITILAKPALKFKKPLTYKDQKLNVYAYLSNDWATNGMKAASFKSSKTDIATVDQDGNLVTTGKSGTTVITMVLQEKGQNGAMNTLKISAKLAVKIPAFKNATITMQTGQKLVVGMKNVTAAMEPRYSVTGSAIITVSDQESKGNPTGKAVVYAEKCGSATLQAVIDNKTYTCEVKVVEPAIKKSELRVKIDKKATVSLKNTKLKKNAIEWKSEDESIASVGANGVVIGHKAGTVKIYTEAGGKRCECNVTVYE